MTAPLIPGPRQTVVRVRHPQRGDGLAVYRNGPSFFLPDGGDPIAMPIGGGGAGGGRSWLRLADPVHGRVEADRCPREGDPPEEHHNRAWSPLFGPGWFVWGKGMQCRFEADAGGTTALDVRSVATGTPDYARRSERTSKIVPMTNEEAQWTTYGLRDGSTLAFRAAPPGEFPRVNHSPAPVKKGKAPKEQPALPGTEKGR